MTLAAGVACPVAEREWLRSRSLGLGCADQCVVLEADSKRIWLHLLTQVLQDFKLGRVTDD